ncbi:helix-turn-helix domain-containing protein [candidate division KSB1 bacterium]|nr:helix-turn-helix domain-containing protein [candidate division KSB1 bacterium]
MRYRAIPPSPYLAKYIECFWTLESGGKSSATSPERILPDGCVELIFNLADSFKRYHSNRVVEIQPQTLVAGQMRRYAMIEPAGRVKLFGVRFHPGGAYPFFQFPLSELTDQIIGFDSVWIRAGKELADRIHSARSVRERIGIIETTLLTRLEQRRNADRLMDAVVRMIVAREGLVSIERLRRNFGVSERQLERKFQTTVGITPKFLCRTLRFQKVFKAVERNQTVNWSFIASECGYYDQAHFIHDFREFSGQNPTAYFSQDHKMSEYFTRKKRLSDFYNTIE